jgi:hypothetical protein
MEIITVEQPEPQPEPVTKKELNAIIKEMSDKFCVAFWEPIVLYYLNDDYSTDKIERLRILLSLYDAEITKIRKRYSWNGIIMEVETSLKCSKEQIKEIMKIPNKIPYVDYLSQADSLSKESQESQEVVKISKIKGWFNSHWDRYDKSMTFYLGVIAYGTLLLCLNTIFKIIQFLMG